MTNRSRRPRPWWAEAAIQAAPIPLLYREGGRYKCHCGREADFIIIIPGTKPQRTHAVCDFDLGTTLRGYAE